MAKRTDELNDYSSNNGASMYERDSSTSYPNDTLNRVGAPDVDDEMLDPLEDTVVETVVVAEVEPYDDTENFDERDIEQTRAQVGETIGAIQDKLRPQTLAQQAKDAISQVGSHAKDTITDVTHTAVQNVVDEAKGAYHGMVDPVKDTVGSAMGSVKDTVGSAMDSAKDGATSLYQVIRRNPIPIGMAALSLFWFYRSMRDRSSRSDYNQTIFTPQSGMDQSTSMMDHVSDTASSMKDKAASIAGTVQDKASDMKDRAQDKLGEMGGMAKDKLGDVRGKAQDVMVSAKSKAQEKMQSGATAVQGFHQSNPLAMGAIALLAGAIVGMMLPSTDVENRVMGETRDRMTDKISDKAQEMKDKVGTVAQTVIDNVKETAVQEAQNQGLMPSNDGSSNIDQEQPQPTASVNEVMGIG